MIFEKLFPLEGNQVGLSYLVNLEYGTILSLFEQHKWTLYMYTDECCSVLENFEGCMLPK